jgi:hypothetical protein
MKAAPTSPIEARTEPSIVGAAKAEHRTASIQSLPAALTATRRGPTPRSSVLRAFF